MVGVTAAVSNGPEKDYSLTHVSLHASPVEEEGQDGYSQADERAHEPASCLLHVVLLLGGVEEQLAVDVGLGQVLRSFTQDMQ